MGIVNFYAHFLSKIIKCMGEIFSNSLLMDYDIYVNYGPYGEMSTFHLVSRVNPIVDDYKSKYVDASYIVRDGVIIE